MCTSEPERTSAASAKAASSGSPRSPPPPPRSWPPGSPNAPACPPTPLFVTRRGTPLSRDALERRIAKYTATAALSCPALHEKKVSPHVLRHSAAMRLLNAGVDTSVIALWMGHENIGNHTGLHPRRLGTQRTGDRPHRPARHSARPLPATRHRTGLPRRTVIMPNTRSRERSPPPIRRRPAGITGGSA